MRRYVYLCQNPYPMGLMWMKWTGQWIKKVRFVAGMVFFLGVSSIEAWGSETTFNFYPLNTRPVVRTQGADGKVDFPPNPVCSGLNFAGWFDDRQGGIEFTSGSVFSSDKTLYARWTVEVPDRLLLKVINKNIDRTRSDDVPVFLHELEAMTSISIKYSDGTRILASQHIQNYGKKQGKRTCGLKSLKGLEFARGLISMDLTEGDISDLSPLASLTSLRQLEFDRNEIRDVGPLASLTEMTHLDLYNNLITDISPLRGLTKLRLLDVHFNTQWDGTGGITDVSVVRNMPELVKLDICSNKILEDISPVEGLKKLQILDFSDNAVFDYRPAVGMAVKMLKKNLFEGDPDWSLGFAGQNVNGQTVETSGRRRGEVVVSSDAVEAEFPSPFLGLDEIAQGMTDGEADTFFSQGTIVADAGIEYRGYDREHRVFRFILSGDVDASGLRKTYNVEALTLSADDYRWILRDFKITRDGLLPDVPSPQPPHHDPVPQPGPEPAPRPNPEPQPKPHPTPLPAPQPKPGPGTAAEKPITEAPAEAPMDARYDDSGAWTLAVGEVGSDGTAKVADQIGRASCRERV